ncbi:MAG: proteasome assembly chaperone family protein [Methanobacteriota archaeon]
MSDGGGIETRPFRPFDLSGGAIVVGIPTVSMVAPIAASHLVGELGLDQALAFESERFPPTTMIYGGKPKFPMRLYVSEEERFGLVLAEFAPPPSLARPIAKALLSLAAEAKVRRIVGLEGIPVFDLDASPGSSPEPTVRAIGATEAARDWMRSAKVPTLERGMLAGPGGVLLNEGRWLGLDVVMLTVPTIPDFPDARAAAALVAAVNRLFPNLRVRIAPLEAQAAEIDALMRSLREQMRGEPQAPRGEMMYG